MTKNPALTPKQNRIVFLKPNRLANSIAIILFGPGVKLVTKTYKKKDNKDIATFLLCMYVIMCEKDNITIYYILYIMDVILYTRKEYRYGGNSFNSC